MLKSKKRHSFELFHTKDVTQNLTECRFECDLMNVLCNVRLRLWHDRCVGPPEHWNVIVISVKNIRGIQSCKHVWLHHCGLNHVWWTHSHPLRNKHGRELHTVRVCLWSWDFQLLPWTAKLIITHLCLQFKAGWMWNTCCPTCFPLMKMDMLQFDVKVEAFTVCVCFVTVNDYES